MAQYAVIMLIAGFGVPILAAMNAGLGRHVGSPAAAAVVLFVVALVASLAVAIATGPHMVSRFATAPRPLFLGGVLIAFYVLTVTYIAPVFGLGNAVFFVLLGQLISAAAIDHFGLFGAQVSPLGLARAGGIVLMAVGVWLTQQV
ncbi:hypothetical protein Z946_3265 [Sulfitobacter noctilucicola]|uniref:Transporter family-2 protein n=1 Tax=Sulfitobacter noctilucicola TaxID=1342301 RepID=A0A7W6M8P8_9RHOB|nr:DMT family transporter [Sulfitobacter noctilucicola]KIN64374.1 hypothetical protein Z946_3265 [Sulfitobacter noctilucicola]MBB4174465.1 transporter family-2 protein [Sulfitobacter noctilucicola]